MEREILFRAKAIEDGRWVYGGVTAPTHEKDGKITHEELAYFTGIMGRTNTEMRDAALLAWNHAGLPIRVKPIEGKKRVINQVK